MVLIAGLDFGSSSVKIVVCSTNGDVIARGHSAYPTHIGLNGEVEQHPEDWWRAAAQVLAQTGVADQLEAIGLTGQMQDLVLVAGDRNLRPALLYSDTRAEAQHRQMVDVIPEWERRTGNHQDVTNVAAKIAWLAEHENQTLERADHLLFSAAGYIAWRAGAAAACDVTTASTTGLLDVHTRSWMPDGVASAGANLDQMPQLIGDPGREAVGSVSDIAADELGVSPGLPIVLAMGDAGATTDGLIGSEPGDAYLYLGTTGWLAGVTATAPAAASPIHSLVMPGWQRRLRIGAVQSAGSAANWARTTFLPGFTFDEVEAVVGPRVDELTTRPLCLPGLSGERTPVRDGAFRGAFVGVHDNSVPADFYLAVLTGVAMGLRHAADDMGIKQDRIPVVGGAASSPVWRTILADVFDAAIVTGEVHDPGCHAAARAAAKALGMDHQLMPLLGRGAIAAAIETVPSSTSNSYAELLVAHRQLYEALTPTFHYLAKRAWPNEPAWPHHQAMTSVPK